MRVSREQVAQNRKTILEAASRLFRARGFDAVTVAEVMQAAGLTHGGFYGYFKSKDDLVAQSLAYVLGEGAKKIDPARFVDVYLGADHRDDLAGGCPVAALSSETLRQAPEARAAMTAGLRRDLEHLTATAAGETDAERRQAAIGGWSAMVGALILARMSDDPTLSDEVLAETRAFIARQTEDNAA